MRILIVLLVLSGAVSAHAWGRRGHSIVCETAALLLDGEAPFFKSSAFDLGYYCNVPDLVWKKGDLYKQEWFNHFMDLEVFDRALRGSTVLRPFDLKREEFNRSFPAVRNDAGRAWWRIRELNDKLTDVTRGLREASGRASDQHSQQASWLVLAGAIGHYVGDLSQPLHVSENFDGQLTKQKGIHAYFEDQIVDQLYLQGDLLSEVLKSARATWAEKRKALATRTDSELIRELTEDSMHRLPDLLMLDLKAPRRDVEKDAVRFRQLCISRLAAGAVTLSEIWRRQIGWKFDHRGFYNFEGQPSYIAAP